jgi:hypothetical protein
VLVPSRGATGLNRRHEFTGAGGEQEDPGTRVRPSREKEEPAMASSATLQRMRRHRSRVSKSLGRRLLGWFHGDGENPAIYPTVPLSIADTSGFNQKAQTAAPKTSKTAAMMNGACHDP